MFKLFYDGLTKLFCLFVVGHGLKLFDLFRLLRRLRQRQIVFVRDDFAVAFLLQLAAGVAGVAAGILPAA
jgi:hypothetical protein